MERSTAHAGHAAPTGTTYNINFQTSRSPTAGEEVELAFVVTEQRIGDALQEFELLHDRLMHVIIVDESLSYFAHVHPILDWDTFRLSYVFPIAGRYKLWTEVQPVGGQSVLAAFRLTVAESRSGQPAAEPSAISPYRVGLEPSGHAPLHEPVELAFQVEDTAGDPITDLEPLMAAGGHCVIISSDLRDFIYVHPLEEVDLAWRGGPRVKFLTSFHRPLRHKVWGQFQHRGELITAPFEIEVEAGTHH